MLFSCHGTENRSVDFFERRCEKDDDDDEDCEGEWKDREVNSELLAERKDSNAFDSSGIRIIERINSIFVQLGVIYIEQRFVRTNFQLSALT